jgi:hypothetical protein
MMLAAGQQRAGRRRRALTGGKGEVDEGDEDDEDEDGATGKGAAEHSGGRAGSVLAGRLCLERAGEGSGPGSGLTVSCLWWRDGWREDILMMSERRRWRRRMPNAKIGPFKIKSSIYLPFNFSRHISRLAPNCCFDMLGPLTGLSHVCLLACGPPSLSAVHQPSPTT